tara:strand:+ start:6545 stop:7192 length:648 start_codon:yes stop_codon:yes gene_type:complete
MGVVVITNKPSRYEKGAVVMRGSVDREPVGAGVTYLVYDYSPTKKEAEAWVQHVEYRLVFVVKRKPSYATDSEANILVDWESNSKWDRTPNAMLRWTDRERVAKAIEDIPVPILLSHLRPNVKDIGLWRLLAKASFNVPEWWVQRILAYKVKPTRNSRPPKRMTKQITGDEFGYRSTDLYLDTILANQKEPANEYRDKADEVKHIRKTKQKGDWL